MCRKCSLHSSLFFYKGICCPVLCSNHCHMVLSCFRILRKITVSVHSTRASDYCAIFPFLCVFNGRDCSLFCQTITQTSKNHGETSHRCCRHAEPQHNKSKNLQRTLNKYNKCTDDSWAFVSVTYFIAFMLRYVNAYIAFMLHLHYVTLRICMQSNLVYPFYHWTHEFAIVKSHAWHLPDTRKLTSWHFPSGLAEGDPGKMETLDMLRFNTSATLLRKSYLYRIINITCFCVWSDLLKMMWSSPWKPGWSLNISFWDVNQSLTMISIFDMVLRLIIIKIIFEPNV